MVSRIRSRASLGLAILGLVIVAGGLVLPLVKTHQEAIGTGPTSPYGSSDYTLSEYLIPEVDRESTVTVVVSGFSPHSMSFYLFPTQGDLSPSGPSLYSVADVNSSILRFSFASPATTAYAISIDSKNPTQFVVAVDGIWSPYYFLRGYLAEGAFIALGGLLAFTYFRYWEYRRSLEEKATDELAKSTGAKGQ